MAPKNYTINLIIMIIGFILFTGGKAQTQSNCTSTLMTLSSCLNYVTGNSSTPSQPCCSSLANVVQTQPWCLCSLLNTGAGFTVGLAINQTLALALPSACNVQTPPVSQCNAVGNAPAAAPAPSTVSPPTDASTEQPPETPSTSTSVPSVPSVPSGSKTGPSNTGSTSDGSKVTSSPVHIAFATLFIAASIVNAFHF